MANHKAFEQKLSCLAVVLVNLLQNLFSVSALAKVTLEANTSEFKLILGQCTCLVAEDVIDAAELLRELHALDAARDHITFFNANHICIFLNELGNDNFTQLSVNDQIEGHQAHQHQEEGKEREADNCLVVVRRNVVLR